jgi:hypothetical protein
MFHDLSVFQPEDINDSVARVANQADPMTVQNNEIAVCKRALPTYPFFLARGLSLAAALYLR